MTTETLIDLDKARESALKSANMMARAVFLQDVSEEPDMSVYLRNFMKYLLAGGDQDAAVHFEQRCLALEQACMSKADVVQHTQDTDEGSCDGVLQLAGKMEKWLTRPMDADLTKRTKRSP